MNTTSMPETDGLISLLPHYVYVLMDPDENSVFYVGKGQGSRVQAHLQEHDRLVNKGEVVNHPKMERISKIKASGKHPKELVIGRYETEDEAYAVEATLIKWVYGFTQLTNLVEGHGSRFIRAKDQHNSLPGIDVPTSERTRDGSFRNAKVAGLSAAGAFDLQESLRMRLIEAEFEVRDFSAKEDKQFDPGASNGWLGLLVRIGKIDFSIGFSKTCRPAVVIANTQSSRSEEAIKQMKRIEEKKGPEFKVGRPKNIKGRYRSFDANPKFNNLDDLIYFLKRLREI